MRILVLMVLLTLLVAGEAPPADRFDRTGPQPGEWLPDVPVTRLDGQVRTLHQESQGLTLLVTSSFTCPKSRSRYESLKALAGRFEHQLRVVLVYVIEAHPVVDVCPYKGVVDVTTDNQRDGILFRQPTTMAERLALARAFRDHQRIELSIVVDHLENRAWTALGAAPNLALVVDSDRRILLRQGWYEGTTLEGELRRLLAKTGGGDDRARKEQDAFDQAVEIRLLDETHDLAYRFRRGDPLVLEELKKHPELSRYRVRGIKEADGWLIQFAAEDGHRDHVAALLDAGAVIDVQSDRPAALHLAAKNGHLAVVDLLLERGAARDLRSFAGVTAMQAAAFAGHSAVVTRLRAAGATSDLLVAAAVGEVEVVRAALISDPSRAFLTDGEHRPLVMYAAANGHTAVIDLALRAGVSTDGGRHRRPGTPLHAACDRGQGSVVRQLLAAGAIVEAEVYGIGTPLLCAARHGHLACAKTLLEAGAKTGVFDEYGYAPLHHAASRGHDALVATLLDHGADPRLGTREGYGGCMQLGGRAPLDTALHLATRRQSLAVMRRLIAHPAGGALVLNDDHETPLFQLVGLRPDADTADTRRATITLLLDAGCDLKAEDRMGRTVLDHALKHQDHELAGWLRERGAQPGSNVARPAPPAEGVLSAPINQLDVPVEETPAAPR